MNDRVAMPSERETRPGVTSAAVKFTETAENYTKGGTFAVQGPREASLPDRAHDSPNKAEPPATQNFPKSQP
jgi:hypothetical protein